MAECSTTMKTIHSAKMVHLPADQVASRKLVVVKEQHLAVMEQPEAQAKLVVQERPVVKGHPPTQECPEVKEHPSA